MIFWSVFSSIIWLVGSMTMLGLSYDDIKTYKSIQATNLYAYYGRMVSKERAKVAQKEFKVSLLGILLTPLAFILLPVLIICGLIYGAKKMLKTGLGKIEIDDDEDDE